MGKDTYSLENFKMESVIQEVIGWWNEDVFGRKGWNINYSDILTFLIKKAGTICEYYASDLFISWDSLKKEMEKQGRDYNGGKYLFGFRETGVDHNSSVFCRLNTYGLENFKEQIKELYLLEVSIKRINYFGCDDEIEMKLGKVNMDEILNLSA